MNNKNKNRYGGVVLLAVFFSVGYLAGERFGFKPSFGTVYECSSDRLVGVLFTDDAALSVPGRLVLAWDSEDRKKLVSRDLFEVCATVE